MKNFFSTANVGSGTVNKILISASLKHAQNLEELKVINKSDVCTKTNLIRAMNLKAIGLLLKGICISIFAPGKMATVRYGDVLVGRYALATAFRSYKSYASRFSLITTYSKSLLKCGLYCEIAKKLVSDIEALYLDHGCYENGVFYEVMALNNVPIYHNQYPYSLVRFVPKSPGSYEDSLVIPSQIISDEATGKGENMMLRVINDPSNIPYMITKQTNYGLHARYDYVIYSHSFTDAQHYYGYDGAFNNIMEWLEYTIKTLKGFKICIKAHPEIFSEEYATEVVAWDRRLFAEFSAKYADRPDIDIIDRPVNNVDFLRNINKSAVLITHHGNAILEGGMLGFNCICSSFSNWANFDIFNTWSDEKEYRSLLTLPVANLRATNAYELNRYNYLLRSTPQSYFSSSWWVKKVSDISGNGIADIIKDPNCLNDLSHENTSKCIDQLSDSMNTV